MKPGGVGVALRTPKPQVRGSVLELGKVDSNLSSLQWVEKIEDQACLGTEHWGFRVRLTA